MRYKRTIAGILAGLALLLSASTARASYTFPAINAALSQTTGTPVVLTCRTIWEWPTDVVAVTNPSLRGYWWLPTGAVIRPDLCGQVLALFVDPLGGTSLERFQRGYALRTAVHEAFHYVSQNEAVTECLTMKSVPGLLVSLGVSNPAEYQRGADAGHLTTPPSYQGGVC